MDIYKEARDRLIVALDMPPRDILESAQKLKGHVGAFKVNSAFTAYGPELLVHIFRNAGPVFLDIKFCDIPNTVANHVEQATRLGEGASRQSPAEPWVSMMTMHTAAGAKAMKMAKERILSTSFEIKRKPPLILGITVLTSMDNEAASNVGLTEGIRTTVLKRAELAAECGLDGLVCSGHEVEGVRKVVGNDMKLVVPGIRPAGDSADDQARVVTPAKAIAAGADYLVVGRSIYGAENPATAADGIVHQMVEALDKG